MTTALKFESADPKTFYHNGKVDKKTHRPKAPDHMDREIIAWDMEGISHWDKGNFAQSAVIFGCSIEPEKRLLAKDLNSREMLEYILDVGKRYPHAVHVGYAFKYDANMLIKNLSQAQIVELWKNGMLRFRLSNGRKCNVHWIPGKKFTITAWYGGDNSNSRSRDRHRGNGQRVSVTIYDYHTFFGGAFLDTAEKILQEDLSEYDRQTIAHGKAARGHQSWNDIDEIEHYWQREILLIQRVFEKFRKVMYRAGFHLKEWYGPGALANYIITQYGLRDAVAGTQSTSGVLPPEVHNASKVAFFGGRFELFQAGRIKGPVYSIDINSAYPYALTKIPSVALAHGKWRHVDNPTEIERFGFYRVRFAAPNAQGIEYRPMPFPHRDTRGMISFPNMVHGWYASPEAMLAVQTQGAVVEEGWYWEVNESGKDVGSPFAFLQTMYDRRMKIGKKNLMSMPFKLGPNSLYGKFAQTVGWDKEKMLPPKSHALPIAAWVTSYCRAMLWSIIRQIPDKVIAVETDSVFTTVDPRTLPINIGDELGQWGVTEYEELVYIQSGMYHYKQNGEWKGTRSRGLNKAEYNYDDVNRWLSDLIAGKEWDPLTVETKPRFIGAGAAAAMSQTGRPFKMSHCTWRAQTKEIKIADTGKRIHNGLTCKSCQQGLTPNEAPHRLLISSRSDGETLSLPRRLPWEAKGEHPEEVKEIRLKEMLENEFLDRH